MNILEEICNHQLQLVDELKRHLPITELEQRPAFNAQSISLKEAFLKRNTPGIIAEFKRRSPSVPVINLAANPASVVQAYEKAGAIAASVLTNYKYFGGNDADLLQAKSNSRLPILRKEFIVDEYQVFETKSLGADVMLLIAAALTKEKLLQLAKRAKALGLEVLLEIKDEAELDYINPFVDFIGVNNRDLSTFKVDVAMSEKLAGLIPSEFIKVSESGISNPVVVNNLTNCGYKGFLIGECFMTQINPGEACAQFIASCETG